MRLVHAPSRPAQGFAELRAIAVLEKEGEISYGRLVQTLADGLYREELRHGAAVVDIGLFGSRLFERDAVEVLQAANGILWEIG